MTSLLDVDLRSRRRLRWLRPLTVTLLALAVALAAAALYEAELELRDSERAVLQNQLGTVRPNGEDVGSSSVDPAAVADERLVQAVELNTRLLAVERCATQAARADVFQHDAQSARSELTVQATSAVALDQLRDCLNAGEGPEHWSVRAVESRGVGGPSSTLVAQLVVLGNVPSAISAVAPVATALSRMGMSAQLSASRAWQ